MDTIDRIAKVIRDYCRDYIGSTDCTYLGAEDYGKEKGDRLAISLAIQVQKELLNNESGNIDRGYLAILRRLYHHKLNGGDVSAEDLSRVIKLLEKQLDKKDYEKQ